MNQGKIFEQDFKDSVPEDVFYYRLNDGTANYSRTENVRFQNPNLCDCIIFHKGHLFLLELKSVAKNSMPLTNIRDNQLAGLSMASAQDGVVAGFIVNYRHVAETYFLSANTVYEFINIEDRKSIPLSYAQSHGIKIEQKIKKVHYKYDVESFLDTMAQLKAF